MEKSGTPGTCESKHAALNSGMEWTSAIRWLLSAVVTLGLWNLGLAAILEAQERLEVSEMDLDELGAVPIAVVTGIPQPISEAPAVASVITAKQIEAMGATHLDKVLETVPGLHVALSQTRPLGPIYSIRGIHSQNNTQVLTLVNGIPITELLGGGLINTFRLPLAIIARIEVIRGPGSAVYGADAFAGVINIITKSAEDIDGTEVGMRLGSFDSQEVWVQHGGKWAGWNVAWSLAWQKSGGDRDRIVNSDQQTVFDGLFFTDASLAPGPLETRFEVFDMHLGLERDHWNINLWHWDSEAGLGAGAAQALDPEGNQDQYQVLADVRYRNADLVEDWELGARFRYRLFSGTVNLIIFPPGALLPIGSDGNLSFEPSARPVSFPDGLIGRPGADMHMPAVESTAVYTGLAKHRFRFSAGFEFNRMETSESKNFGPGVIMEDQTVSDGTLTEVTGDLIFIQDKERELWFVSLQDEWSFARGWQLTAGLRFDHYSEFGRTINPRLALVWATNKVLTTKLLYGSAFRPPSFTEQFNMNTPLAVGNRELEPETINTLELVLDYRPRPGLRSVLSLFTYEVDDLIDFLPDPGTPSRTAQNVNRQEGYGFELDTDWRLNDAWRLQGNYAWQRSEDQGTGARIAGAPGQQLYLAAHWRFRPEWSVDARFNWVADRVRDRTLLEEPPPLADCPLADCRPPIEDYTLVDLTLRRKRVAEHWDFALAVRNIFDEDAREPSTNAIPEDYPLERRHLYLEMRYRF